MDQSMGKSKTFDIDQDDQKSKRHQDLNYMADIGATTDMEQQELQDLERELTQVDKMVLSQAMGRMGDAQADLVAQESSDSGE